MAAASKDVSKRNKAQAPKRIDQTPQTSDEKAPNPVWFKPVMFGFMVLGLIWIVTYYVTASTLALPVPQLGQGNILVGFGLMLIGFLMTTRWR
jgi:hypothetical protein